MPLKAGASWHRRDPRFGARVVQLIVTVQARLIQRKYGYIFPRLYRSTAALFPGNHLQRGTAPPLVDRNGVFAIELRGHFGIAPRPDTDTLRRSAAQR